MHFASICDDAKRHHPLINPRARSAIRSFTRRRAFYDPCTRLCFRGLCMPLNEWWTRTRKCTHTNPLVALRRTCRAYSMPDGVVVRRKQILALVLVVMQAPRAHSQHTHQDTERARKQIYINDPRRLVYICITRQTCAWHARVGRQIHKGSRESTKITNIAVQATQSGKVLVLSGCSA